ncbi:MAG: hypothetical protein KK476_04810 [Sinorhizobium fredii]|nr:hypothetical protein [Sinorhizobium fredii]
MREDWCRWQAQRPGRLIDLLATSGLAAFLPTRPGSLLDAADVIGTLKIVLLGKSEKRLPCLCFFEEAYRNREIRPSSLIKP